MRTGMKRPIDRLLIRLQSAIYRVFQWLGDLNEMEPGKGYCVLMTAPASLIYPNSGEG